MAESLKSSWSVLAGNQSCSCLGPTECTRDGCRGGASGSEINHGEALTPSTRTISDRRGSLEVAGLTPEPPQFPGLEMVNPAGWDPFLRTPGLAPASATSLSTFESRNYDATSMQPSAHPVTPIISLLGPITHSPDAGTLNSAIDRPQASLQYSTRYPFSSHVPSRRLVSSLSSDRRRPYNSRTAPSTPPVLYSDSDNSTLPVTRFPTLTPTIPTTPLLRASETSSGHSSDDDGEHHRVGRRSRSTSDDVTRSLGTSSIEREVRTDESDLREQFAASGEENANEGFSFRRSSISPRQRSIRPLNSRISHGRHTVADVLRRAASEDRDDLPALLPMPDLSVSESGRPYSPDTTTDSSSQMTNEDGRTRYLHPGTPIQTELPEIQTLLRQFQTGERFPVDHVMRRLDAAMAQSGHVDSQASWDDGFTGDVDRARELLDGLELVDEELVERYQKVRGDGDDICAICRDFLLRYVGGDTPMVEATPIDSIVAANVSASIELPFMPPCSEMSVYAFPCTHLFHMDCLLPWLSLKTTCPTCRLDLDPHSLTLRVRGWDSSPWSYSVPQARAYVNTDRLGRRVPWRRPAAPSLDEWVRRREQENSVREDGTTTLRHWSGQSLIGPGTKEQGSYAENHLFTGSLHEAFSRISQTVAPGSAIPGRHDTPRRGHPTRDGPVLGTSSWRRPQWHRPVRYGEITSDDGLALPRQDSLSRSTMHANGRLPYSSRVPPNFASVATPGSSQGHHEPSLPPEQTFHQNTFALMSRAVPARETIAHPVSEGPNLSIAASRQSALTRALDISRRIGDLLNQARGATRSNSSPDNDEHGLSDPERAHSDVPAASQSSSYQSETWHLPPVDSYPSDDSNYPRRNHMASEAP